MDDPNTTLFLDEHAAAIVAAARRQIQSGARRDLDALKAALAAQLTALERTPADEEVGPELDRAIAQLCEAAQVTIQITQAQLEGETHNRMAVSAELQAVNQKLLQARAEADALRLQLHRADRSRAPQAPPPPAVVDHTDAVCDALDRLDAALKTLDRTNVGARLVTAVFDLTGERFARIALCAPEGNAFVVWRSRGFEPALPRKTVLRVGADSPLARAAADWEAASQAASGRRPLVGVLGAPIGYAIAVPIVAKGRGAAILYAENPPEAVADSRIAGKLVEILVGYVRSRVQIKTAGATAAKTPYATQRRAKRVRMADGTMIVVDNSESELIDLSSLGAQVVSRQAMRPDSPVHIVLPSDGGGVACTGRVVWVIVEQQPNAASARYRAGVQFTDVKRGELDGFIDFFDSGIRH